MRDLHLLASFVTTIPWALDRDTLATVATVIARHAAGLEPTADALEDAAAINAKRRTSDEDAQRSAPASIAVLPIQGVILPRSNRLTRTSGTTTAEAIVDGIGEALDRGVGGIVLDIDSPGGSTAGGAVVAQAVRDARDRVPTIAQVQYSATSLAYWIASGASEIVAAPGSIVGSIGSYLIHDDLSRALNELGIARTYISAGEFKVDPNETSALTPQSKARLQHLVDQSYAQFTRDVAAGRRVPLETVLEHYGKGKILTAEDALPLGMIDRIGTLDATIDRLARRVGASSSAAPVPAPAPASTSSSDRAWRHAVALELHTLSLRTH